MKPSHHIVKIAVVLASSWIVAVVLRFVAGLAVGQLHLTRHGGIEGVAALGMLSILIISIGTPAAVAWLGVRDKLPAWVVALSVAAAVVSSGLLCLILAVWYSV